ncbi:hypothetical protein ABZP36_001686 [Zizania latifolia]
MAGSGGVGDCGDWPFSADAYADSSAIFSELGWASGLVDVAAGELLPPLDPPEATPPPPETPAGSVDGAASSCSTGDGAAADDADGKPTAASTEAA